MHGLHAYNYMDVFHFCKMGLNGVATLEVPSSFMYRRIHNLRWSSGILESAGSTSAPDFVLQSSAVNCTMSIGVWRTK
jgi:hypothetical protein